MSEGSFVQVEEGMMGGGGGGGSVIYAAQFAHLAARGGTGPHVHVRRRRRRRMTGRRRRCEAAD